MAAARSEYPGFIASAEGGELDATAAHRLESDLGANVEATDRTYLALSSLAYAYYRLAQRAANDPNQRDVLADRFTHWNAIWTRLYEDSGDPNLRLAGREAAEDLYRRTPRTDEASCQGCSTSPVSNDAPGALLATLRGADQRAADNGVRGALSRLLARLRGTDDAEASP